MLVICCCLCIGYADYVDIVFTLVVVERVCYTYIAYIFVTLWSISRESCVTIVLQTRLSKIFAEDICAIQNCVLNAKSRYCL